MKAANKTTIEQLIMTKSDDRAKNLNLILQRLRNGFYTTSEVTERIAKKILEEHLCHELPAVKEI